MKPFLPLPCVSQQQLEEAKQLIPRGLEQIVDDMVTGIHPKPVAFAPLH